MTRQAYPEAQYLPVCAVRIEAQAGAGRIIQEMQETGQLAKRGDFGTHFGRAPKVTLRRKDTLDGPPRRQKTDLGLNYIGVHRWKKVALVPVSPSRRKGLTDGPLRPAWLSPGFPKHVKPR